MHSTIRWLTFDFETEYIFCKDNRLVLIVECLFKKASTAELLKLRLLLHEQQTKKIALKQHTQNQSVLAHTLKVAILTS